jgi:uncharacterized protein YukE
MVPSERATSSELKQVQTGRSAYWNGKTSGSYASRMLRRSKYLTNFLQMIITLRSESRYVETGESGETYDAEMEAAAREI